MNARGKDAGDLSTMSGAVGWRLSVDDLLAVMASFRRLGTMVDPARAQIMLDRGFGIDQVRRTPLGLVYAKGGFWSFEKGTFVQQTNAIFLPKGMELAILANSPLCTPDTGFIDRVLDAIERNVHLRLATLTVTAVAGFALAGLVGTCARPGGRSGQAGAALLPIIDLNGNAQHSQQSKTTGSTSVINVSRSGASVAIINNNLTATLNASYEIDFWGKNRSLVRAAEETAVAPRYDREVVGLATVVATANAYFQVLAAQDRLRVARENLASATRVLNLIQQRLQAGTASALDTAQQESLVNTQRAAIPPLEQTLRQNRVALASTDGPFARKREHSRWKLAQHCLSTRDAGAAIRTPGATTRYPRSRGAISPPPTPML